MNSFRFTCPKCSNTEYKTDTIRTTGGFLSKIFDVQNKKFTTVTCTRCSFTEFYRTDSSMLGNIFDFLTD
ncbi:GTP-binding protein [candidate division KSB1 bacterium]|nr:GTP-binding protein [candidate division KSB1 bacterium]